MYAFVQMCGSGANHAHHHNFCKRSDRVLTPPQPLVVHWGVEEGWKRLSSTSIFYFRIFLRQDIRHPSSLILNINVLLSSPLLSYTTAHTHYQSVIWPKMRVAGASAYALWLCACQLSPSTILRFLDMKSSISYTWTTAYIWSTGSLYIVGVCHPAASAAVSSSYSYTRLWKSFVPESLLFLSVVSRSQILFSRWL